MSTMIFYSGPEDEVRAQRESYERNQAVAKLLFEKGFTLFTLNMFLAVEPDPLKESGDAAAAEGEPRRKE